MLEVDNTAVRESQMKRLQKLRQNRDAAAVEAVAGCADALGRDRAKATCWRWRSTPRARAPRWARFRLRSRKSWAGTKL